MALTEKTFRDTFAASLPAADNILESTASIVLSSTSKSLTVRDGCPTLFDCPTSCEGFRSLSQGLGPVDRISMWAKGDHSVTTLRLDLDFSDFGKPLIRV